MNLELTGKVALVTGASVGLGRTIAKLLAQEGCRLAVVARRAHLLEEVADGIESDGAPRPLVIVEDVTADGMQDRIKEQIDSAFGRLDILVNNAGGSRPMSGLGSEEEWAEGMLLNFTAARRLTHAFVPMMRDQKYGRIINLTGLDEPTGMNAAVPPNGAVQIWAKALSREVGRDGVTVNSIPPGRIHSEQIDERILPGAEAQQAWADEHCPAGYVGEPEDLAVLVVFLSSPRTRYINGQVIHVDGGMRRFSH